MQLTGTKEIQVLLWLGGKTNPLWIVQEIKISPYKQMVYAKTRIRPGKWDIKFSGILR